MTNDVDDPGLLLQRREQIAQALLCEQDRTSRVLHHEA